jgi:hypothetical protein
LFDLVEHEHTPAAQLDPRQGTAERLEGPPTVDGGGLWGLNRLLVLRYTSIQVQRVSPSMPARIRRDAQHDLIKPATRSSSTIDELFPAPMYDDEHLL